MTRLLPSLLSPQSAVMARGRIVAIFLLLLCTAAANAQLVRVGPLDRNNGFPAWYQDSTGLALDACLPNAQQLADGTCLVTPDQLSSPNSPITFPTNFPDEFFYWNANANLTVNGGRAVLVMALEGAFLNGPVAAGDQMVFARHRIVLDVPEPGGTYTVTTPFGLEVFPDVTPGKRAIFFTNDVGLTAGDFSGALKGQISTFLRAASVAGGDPLSPVTISGDTFIADPAALTAVTGSPFGTNFFRVEGPNIGGPGIDRVETDQFTLMGKVHLAPIPSPISITRATYRRSGSTGQADIFATARPSIGAPDPVLSITGAGIRGTVMTGSGDHYYAQVRFQSGTVPASVTITNSSDTPTSTAQAALVDEVHISSATYDPATQKLSIHAASGDAVDPPELVAEGYGKLSASGDLEVSLPIPPQEVAVISTRGGRDSRPVSVDTANNAAAPIAQNDELAQELPADVASSIDILANDDPAAGVTPRILASPQHGSVRIDAGTNQAVYTPALGYSGPDSFSYINTDANGVDSNVALVSFNVTFLNHPPVTNPDSATTSAGTPVTIAVLANDTDPDNGDTLNPASVKVVTPPASGAAAVNPDGSITFTPGAGTSATFQYTVQDSHAGTSNAVSVSITILAADTLTITRAQFRTRGDWRVTGTATIAGPGNTITVHIGPTLAGPVLGTVAVDAVGGWDFVLKGSSIRPDATNTISVESTKGGRRLAIPLQITN
jgi:Bacterial Ig domain